MKGLLQIALAFLAFILSGGNFILFMIFGAVAYFLVQVESEPKRKRSYNETPNEYWEELERNDPEY